MSEATNRVRFFLRSNPFGKQAIEDVSDPVLVGGSKYRLEEAGYYDESNTQKIVMRKQGYEYIMGILLAYGPTERVDFIMQVKDDRDTVENWITRPIRTIDLYNVSFGEEADNPSVTCDLVREGDLEAIKAGLRDEFDTVGVNAPPLDFVNLRLDPRRIVRKSRFINSTIVVNAQDDQGKTARAVPLELDYSSDKQFIGEVSNAFANSVGGNYAKLESSGNVIIQNAPRDLVYELNGRIEIESTRRASEVNDPEDSFFTMDLVRYSGGEERNFEEIILNLASGSTASAVGTKFSYDFNDFELIVNEGDSIGIMTLSTSDQGGTSFLYWEYKTTEETFLELVTETPYPVTYTKAVRPRTMFRHMARLILGEDSYDFESSVFGPGGRHENKLLVHGTWLRNMPDIINEGTDEERRIQANLSLGDLYDAYSVLEPLRYDVPFYKGRYMFTVGAFRDIQQNFTGIRITGFTGDDDPVRPLVEVSEKGRDFLGGNCYRSVKIGSETSGSNYGEVNNLFSTAGYAEWSTPHRRSEEKYEVITKFRTGAEDTEIQRQFQYSDNPDEDGEYDNDWFLVDAKKVGTEFVVRGWEDYYSEKPTGVYSPDTNYNWPFTPVEMLRGHGYKINVGLANISGAELTNPNGNCNLSLVTKRTGEDYIISNLPFPASLFDRPRIAPFMIQFETPMTPEIEEVLDGTTRTVDNKFGLVKVKYRGKEITGRLFEATTDKIAKFKIIEAVV